jgi:hypothetical protein
VSPGNLYRNWRIDEVGEFDEDSCVQNNGDTVWHEQAENICASNAAAIVDVGDGDNATYRRLDAVANSSFGVTQIAV